MESLVTRSGPSPSQEPNRLIYETSPYLLQHAYNPVDWYPWGPEALSAARSRDLPIFLSIGYSACHWCHVMEHESFEDPATAEVLNSHFVCIKVDREERPDLDQIYMSAVQLMTRHGGWPMSVWLTPDLKPFHGGTYFPPVPRHHLPSFRQILEQIAQVWRERRAEIGQSADTIVSHLDQLGRIEPGGESVSSQLLVAAANGYARAIDRRWGGIGQAPKFPHSVEMRLLLRAALRTGREEPRELALLSIEKMIRGGIYDQLGGGFHRYSTDERWLVPHFEKMLYDNALISLACLEAFQASGEPIFRQACTETLDYVLREMTAPSGGFYSTQDADSEGHEGKFYVWTKDEVDRHLGASRSEVFCYFYDINPEGNWERVNILNCPKTLEQASRLLGRDPEDLSSLLAECRDILFRERSKRVWPGKDEKILTAWNGLMIDAMASAGRALNEPRYRDAAERSARFLLDRLRDSQGGLLRSFKDGKARFNAYLEDYSCLANGLVSVYEATFDPAWIDRALEIVDRMLEQFLDPGDGGFFFTGNDHERLITRGKEHSDNATPSGSSMAVTALARLAKLTGRSDLAVIVDRTLELYSSSIQSSAQMLLGLGLHLGPTLEFAIVGDPRSDSTRALLEPIDRRFLPDKVIALLAPGASPAIADRLPLLANKSTAPDRTNVFICQGFECQAPVSDPDALDALLDRMTGDKNTT